MWISGPVRMFAGVLLFGPKGYSWMTTCRRPGIQPFEPNWTLCVCRWDAEGGGGGGGPFGDRGGVLPLLVLLVEAEGVGRGKHARAAAFSFFRAVYNEDDDADPDFLCRPPVEVDADVDVEVAPG
mmetsp:Transcript_25706/g.61915  ORF Transcript_25706/g.61915 Transcript_25706/m.61915 type:complete len:125 (-) Transcript_25706:280-654(-)